MGPTMPSACWHRSIPSSGIDAASSCSGDGPIDSRLTPRCEKRKLGYYALPMLWRDRVIGWANLTTREGQLRAEFGYVGTAPRERAFKRGLEAEIELLRTFLACQ